MTEPDALDRRQKVMTDVWQERDRQNSARDEGKFRYTCADIAEGFTMSDRVPVLGEEFGEVCKCVCEVENLVQEQTNNYIDLRAELIQTAAVAVAWCEALDSLTNDLGNATLPSPTRAAPAPSPA